MADSLVVSNLRFAPASPEDQERGLLGWLAFNLGGVLRLDGVALRRTSGGRLALSFPARRDARGHNHHYVRPLDDDTRIYIEQQILELLGTELFS